MSLFKIVFFAVFFLNACSASETPEQVVQSFYNELNAVKGNPNAHNNPSEVFSPILEKYLDWNQIINSILVEPRIIIKNSESQENKMQFKTILKSFLEEFMEAFKSAIIKKYSNADYLTKFQNVKEFHINARQIKLNDNKAEIPSTASVETEGQKTKWNLTWKLNRTEDGWKVEDLAIEGGIQIFKTEQDLAQTKFREATHGLPENQEAFEKGLKSIGSMYEFNYS